MAKLNLPLLNFNFGAIPSNSTNKNSIQNPLTIPRRINSNDIRLQPQRKQYNDIIGSLNPSPVLSQSARDDPFAEKIRKANAKLIPEASRDKYKKNYNLLLSWCLTNDIEPLILKQDFKDAIKAHLAIDYNICCSTWNKCARWLKQNMDGYQPTKARM